jgi:hypothetical protein
VVSSTDPYGRISGFLDQNGDTTDKGRSFNLGGFGVGLTTSHRKKNIVMTILKEPQ